MIRRIQKPVIKSKPKPDPPPVWPRTKTAN